VDKKESVRSESVKKQGSQGRRRALGRGSRGDTTRISGTQSEITKRGHGKMFRHLQGPGETSLKKSLTGYVKIVSGERGSWVQEGVHGGKWCYKGGRARREQFKKKVRRNKDKEESLVAGRDGEGRPLGGGLVLQGGKRGERKHCVGSEVRVVLV